MCEFYFFFSSRRRHTRFDCDWSSDVCSSDLKFSPTELRILLAIGNLALVWHPNAHLAGTDWRLFDVGGAMGIAGMGLMLAVAITQHTRALYAAERLG